MASPRSAMRKIGILSLRERSELQERVRALVIVIVAERPVDQHDVDRGVRGDDRRAVFGGVRFDDLDAAALQLLHQRPRRAPLRRWRAELVVDDERAQAQSA